MMLVPTVTLPGGNLDIQWDSATHYILMTGPAKRVFSAIWEA